MVDIEVGEFSRGRRRVNVVTAASLVLTVDAALFLVIAVLGVPFLLFVFGDEDGTWHRWWPLVTWWAVAAVLGAACAAAVIRSIGRGIDRVRRIGVAAAVGTAIAVGVLLGMSFERSPFLAVVGALFVVANVAAAVALVRPPRAESPDLLDDGLGEEGVEMVAGAEPDAGEDEPVGDEPVEDEPRETVDLSTRSGFARSATGPGRAGSAAQRRRMRGGAAMRTMAGVRMTRRPRR